MTRNARPFVFAGCLSLPLLWVLVMSPALVANANGERTNGLLGPNFPAFADVNGNGMFDAGDVSLVPQRIGDTLVLDHPWDCNRDNDNNKVTLLDTNGDGRFDTALHQNGSQLRRIAFTIRNGVLVGGDVQLSLVQTPNEIIGGGTFALVDLSGDGIIDGFTGTGQTGSGRAVNVSISVVSTPGGAGQPTYISIPWAVSESIGVKADPGCGPTPVPPIYVPVASFGGILADFDGDGVPDPAFYPSPALAPNDGFTETAYFAEGASGSVPGFGFDLRFAMANAHPTLPANGLLSLLDDQGNTTHYPVAVPPMARLTVDTRDPAIFGNTFTAFSTVLRSDLPLVFDRLMSWDDRAYGAHLEKSIAEPRTTWYLAEGATGPFDLFYLLQNADLAQTATVKVTYLRLVGAPFEQTIEVPPATRRNIYVNMVEIDGMPGALANDAFSARFESDIPIIVERAMYLNAGGLLAGAGHGSAGIAEPAMSWFLAEGATGPWWDLFYLFGNPGDMAATADVDYLLRDGTVLTKSYPVPANSRVTIHVDDEPFPPDGERLLADEAVAARITSDVPIIVERAMWWPGILGGASWYEAHASAAAAESGVKWGVAEGEIGGPRGVESYVLIANVSNTDGSAKVTLLFDDGDPPFERTFPVEANSRFNVAMLVEFADVFRPGGPGTPVLHKRFSAIVESLGAPPAQFVVEQSIYWSALGQPLMAGGNALATKLQ